MELFWRIAGKFFETFFGDFFLTRFPERFPGKCPSIYSWYFGQHFEFKNKTYIFGFINMPFCSSDGDVVIYKQRYILELRFT
jgi:hypothetical protein